MTGCALFGGFAVVLLAAAVWAQAQLARPRPRLTGEEAALAEASSRVGRYLLGGVALVQLALGAFYREPGSLALAFGLLFLLGLPSLTRARFLLYWIAVGLVLFGFFLSTCL